MKLLNKAHSVVAKAASTDESRYILQGVLLEATKTGMKSIATDGRIMAIVEDIGEMFKSDDFPANVIPATAQNSANSALVPAEAFIAAFKSLPKKTSLPVLQNVALVMGKTETVLGTTDLNAPIVRTVHNIEGAFPNYEQVIPTSTPSLKIKFSPTLLGKALDIAKQFGLDGVTMEFTGDRNPVKITGQLGNQKLTIVVMPLQPDKINQEVA